MDFVKDAFARMDLRQVRHFLIYGTDGFDLHGQPYAERLKIGSDAIFNRLKCLCPDERERSKVSADLSNALTAYEGVYMEFGMKAGARLAYQLLIEVDQPQTETSQP